MKKTYNINLRSFKLWKRKRNRCKISEGDGRLRLGAASLSKLEQDIEGITQKMLLEHLKELIEYGFVDKESHSGYPLHVEYFLTEQMGKQILEALRIMQHIGIEYLKNNGREQELISKNVVPD